ncbi:MAG TPA: MFS transporter [Alphaproteobacteria bacterium]|nr:MFS transporter [Alphaproteobacteria bacterium]
MPGPGIGARRLIPFAIAVALFMENLDSTIIATAVPSIAHSLGTTPLNLSMAVSVYLLSLAIFIPMSGWMADKYGPRTVFAAAIGLFTVSSALCGLSDSLGMLVAARALQGIGGSMMMPVGRLILGRSFAKSELVAAMSYVTIPGLIGPMLGPLIGGAITTYASWRWIFYVNLPIGLIGILFTLRVIDNRPEPSVPPPDLLGFLLVGIGLAGVVMGVENLGRGIVPTWAVAAMVATAALAFLLYWLHSRDRAAPALDLTLFRIPTFRASILGGAVSRIGFGATPFLLPLLFQLAFHRSPLESGSLTFTGAIGAILMKFGASRVVRTFGFRRLLMTNAFVVGGLTMVFAIFTPATPWIVIIAVLTAAGFFRTLQFTCMSSLIYADLPAARMSYGTSIASVAQQISMSLGVAVGATVLHIATELGGASGPTTASFMPTFLIVGIIPITAIFVFMQLSPNAGAEMSGHGRKPTVQDAMDRLGEPAEAVRRRG